MQSVKQSALIIRKLNFSQMKYILYTLLICLVSLSACKRDSSEVESNISENLNTVPTDQFDELPFACDLVKETTMREILGKDIELEVLDGNRSGISAHATSCFYKWSDPVYDVSGVMIQVQRNPLPDELPDFVQAYINNKKWEGENSHENPGEKFKYQDFEGLDVQAIFNEEVDRYYFAKDTKFLCSVAFNYPLPQDKLDAMFVEIANLMLQKV